MNEREGDSAYLGRSGRRRASARGSEEGKKVQGARRDAGTDGVSESARELKALRSILGVRSEERGLSSVDT